MEKEKLREIRNYIAELRTIKKEVIQGENKFLSIEKSRYTLNNGDILVREKVLKNGHDAHSVIILPITENNEVILIVQARNNTKESVLVELVAGYIDEGEQSIEAAKRELQEETGYMAKKLKYLDSFYQDQGCMSSYNYAYLAYDCVEVGKQKLDKDEKIKFFKCSFADTLELVERGYIKDVQSKYVIEKAKQYVR